MSFDVNGGAKFYHLMQGLKPPFIAVQPVRMGIVQWALFNHHWFGGPRSYGEIGEYADIQHFLWHIAHWPGWGDDSVVATWFFPAFLRLPKSSWASGEPWVSWSWLGVPGGVLLKPPDQDDCDIRGLPLIHQVTSMTNLLSLCFNHSNISHDNHYEQ